MRFSINGTPGYGRESRWYNDYQFIGQSGSDATGWNLTDRVGNIIAYGGTAFLAAGDNRWADTTGVNRSNFDYSNPKGKIWDISHHGTIVESPDYQVGNQIGLLGGPYITGPGVIDARAHDGGFSAVFGDGRIYTSGYGWVQIPAGVQAFSALRLGDYILYHTHHWLMLQVIGALRGKRIAIEPTFYPDGYLNGNTVVVGWSQTPADTPGPIEQISLSGLVDISTLSDIVSPPPPPPGDGDKKPNDNGNNGNNPVSYPLPSQVLDILHRFVAKFPVPQIQGGETQEAFEQRCRETWVQPLAEQVVFETADDRWGCKNAGGGRPMSKDSLANNGGVVPHTLINYDMLSGVGTGHPSLVGTPTGEGIPGQVFMPVQPVDHLSGGQQGGNGNSGGGGGDEELKARIQALEELVAQLQGDLSVCLIAISGASAHIAAVDADLSALKGQAVRHGQEIVVTGTASVFGFQRTITSKGVL